MKIKFIIVAFLLLCFSCNVCLCFCSNKLYKSTVMQGILLNDVKGLSGDDSQDVSILVKSDCPGEMVIKTQVTRKIASGFLNKGEKAFWVVKEIGLIKDGHIDYKPFKGKILSINGQKLTKSNLCSDESYNGAVKRAFSNSLSFALYPIHCYQLARDYSNSPFSPLLLLMEPFYFVLGSIPMALSPISAVFLEGCKISLNRLDIVEIEVLEDLTF